MTDLSLNYLRELLWAESFRSVTDRSTWLKNRSFAPGRWAMGYPALYILYRVLNETRPKRILELGLGQSTRMIAQYAAHYKGVEHVVVEHDPDWIAFFKKDFRLSASSRIVRLDWDFVPYGEAESVRVYKDFSSVFAGQSFDFIAIDGPLGGDMKLFSRIDVLRMLPGILDKSFVVLLDDYNRPGEQNTIKAMEGVLQAHDIAHVTGVYGGLKDTIVLCSKNNKFVTSL